MLQLKPQVNATHIAHLECVSSAQWSARGNIVAGSMIATRMSSCIEAVACCTLRQRLLV